MSNTPRNDELNRSANNQLWLAREQRVLAKVMQRVSDPMYGPVIVRGMGSRVWDADGKVFFDLTCGYSAANFGHAYQPLVQVAQTQLNTLTHLTGMSHPGRAELAERLIQHCGKAGGDRVIFNTSGARAVETAAKISLNHRPGHIVSIGPAYHGRSLFTSGLSDTVGVANYKLANPTCLRRPLEELAYCSACPFHLSFPSCELACQRTLIDWIEGHAEQISAVIVEPATGARGYIAPPDLVMQQLREVTARLGILMIADEIQMGLGRCGDWLMSRRQGWQADLVVLGKSLGGGIVPISAVIGPASLIDALPQGSESETFAASPLATAIGCQVIHELASGPWLERAPWIGQRLRQALERSALVQNHALRPAKIETLGASATVELYGCYPEVGQAARAARTIASHLLSAGLLVHYSGPYGTRIVFLPPLTICDQDLDEIERILNTCVVLGS
ncbi:MAG: aminotransferase class III-fold pyridoxal phosphate-dependent enzyme [Pirellulaceae bacterium]|nr:aminotransferase class III-fold pyridoxal phosphate-dependent enzyme [Pirellulaceae bacterium]